MKQSIILEIFNGNIGSQESMTMPKSILESYEKATDALGELEKKLSLEQFNLTKKTIEIYENINSKEIDFYFVEGFKLGLHIGIECSSKT